MPFSGLHSFCSEKHNLSDRHKEYLDSIAQSGTHLLSLISDILDVSKIESGEVEIVESDFDLFELIETIESMFTTRAASKGLVYSVSRSPSTYRYIVSDEGKLRQILVNLVGNALKFTDKGNVSVSFSTKPNGESESLRVDVADTGPGIEAEYIHRLFQPFEQVMATSSSGSGTRLGLTISKQYADLMGGNIEIESDFGKGSIFTLTLPIREGTGDEINREKAPHRKKTGNLQIKNFDSSDLAMNMPADSDSVVLNEKSLSSLQPDQNKALRNAVLGGDIEEILHLLDSIDTPDENTRSALFQLAKSFQYEQILKLVSDD